MPARQPEFSGMGDAALSWENYFFVFLIGVFNRGEVMDNR